MIVPKGYIAFEEAGRELASSYVYADDTQPNGQDFDDGAWCDELWKVAEQLQIKGATGLGIILDIPADDRVRPPREDGMGSMPVTRRSKMNGSTLRMAGSSLATSRVA